MDTILIGVIVVVIIIVLIAIYYYTRDDGWVAIKGVASPGFDTARLQYQSVKVMKNYAKNHPEIIAFTTDGWMKHKVKPLEKWVKVDSIFYVRREVMDQL